METMQLTFSSRIRVICRLLKLKQRDIAELLAVPPSAVSRWASLAKPYKRKVSRQTLQQLCYIEIAAQNCNAEQREIIKDAIKYQCIAHAWLVIMRAAVDEGE